MKGASGLRGWRLSAFAAAALPVGALNTPLTVYLPAHYSSYVGLSLASVGLAFTLVRTLDFGFDPLVGWLVDRTRTRLGQCRPWFALGALALAASCFVLFLARPGAGVGHLLGGLLLVYAGVSIAGVAHPAWAARLSHDYDDRSRIFAWLYFAQSLGAFLLLSTPLILTLLAARGLVAKPAPGAEIRVMGWALIAATPLLVGLALVVVPEPPPGGHGHAPGHGLGAGTSGRASLASYIRLLGRPAMRCLFVADALISFAIGFSIPLFVLFFRARGLPISIINAMVMAYLAAAILSVPAWTWVARRIGKHRAMMVSAAGYVVVIPSLAFIPPARLDLLFPALTLMGLTFAASTFLIRAMGADAADEARLHLGADCTGQVYALLAATQKLGAALALGLAFWLLGRLGFDAAHPAQSPQAALTALTVLYLGAPAVLMAAGALLFVGYRLDAPAHAEILRRLAASRADPAV